MAFDGGPITSASFAPDENRKRIKNEAKPLKTGSRFSPYTRAREPICTQAPRKSGKPPPHRFISAPAGNKVMRLPGGLLGTDHPQEVIEAALAHVVRNRVEAAYARSDLFERRRTLMDEWARYLTQGSGEDTEA